MIDIHSHILPGIDDGSKDRESSLLMLKSLKNSGIDEVIATPHFYPYRENPADFIRRRSSAREKLGDVSETGVKLRLGAEVYYFEGIASLSDLMIKELCAEGTDNLLIEMPFSAWTKRMTGNVTDIGMSIKVKPVLAHVERYIRFGNNLKLLEELREAGVLMQADAAAFDGFFGARKLIKLIKNGLVDFVASDMHGVNERKQEFDRAFSCIESKLGKEALKRIKDNTERWFAPQH